MLQQTSLEVYNEIVMTKRLNQMQQTVYDCIQIHPGIPDRKISELTGLRINCVTPRRNELLKKGLIQKGLVILLYGHKHMTWETL